MTCTCSFQSYTGVIIGTCIICEPLVRSHLVMPACRKCEPQGIFKLVITIQFQLSLTVVRFKCSFVSVALHSKVKA